MFLPTMPFHSSRIAPSATATTFGSSAWSSSPACSAPNANCTWFWITKATMAEPLGPVLSWTSRPLRSKKPPSLAT